jgi:hypothetical protein
MAVTPTQFFDKNMKWFALVLVLLLVFKSVQSCNRNMRLNMSSGQYVHQIDSLKRDYSNLDREYNDTVKKLNFELKLRDEKAVEANKRADAVQSVAEKIKANTTTTVNVRGATIDTINNKKK